jgi:hypothetical protein
MLLLPRALHAQSDTVLPVINPSVLSEGRILFSAEARPDLSLAPPPPFATIFTEPQVGPLIKHSYPDVVDRRTTAWIPSSSEELAVMSAVDMAPMIESGERWVHVDLSEQLLVAYSGGTAVRAFVISSGLPNTPTVTGEFRVRAKVRAQLMEGGSAAENNYYYLPNVEWVQYFYKDYGLHGTYWHNDFGRPKSHGCINMTNADANWLWEFLGPDWDGSEWQTVHAPDVGSLVVVTE